MVGAEISAPGISTRSSPPISGITAHQLGPGCAFEIQRSLTATIRNAALCLPGGKRHPHQRRIPQSVLNEAEYRLQRALNTLKHAPDFAALRRRRRKAIKSIHGIGMLTVYDVAHRVGAFLARLPALVYLHAGTRAGAAAGAAGDDESCSIAGNIRAVVGRQDRGLPLYLQGPTARRGNSHRTSATLRPLRKHTLFSPPPLLTSARGAGSPRLRVRYWSSLKKRVVMNMNTNRYLDLLNFRTAEEAYAQVKKMASSLSDDEHLIRSCIFDLHAAAEIELRRIFYRTFKTQLFLTDDEEQNQKTLAQFDKMIDGLSFMGMYRVLQPILKSWPSPDLQSIQHINETRNLAAHKDSPEGISYRGRNPFKDADCFAQMYFDVWAFKQSIAKYFELAVERPIERLRAQLQRYVTKYGEGEL